MLHLATEPPAVLWHVTFSLLINKDILLWNTILESNTNSLCLQSHPDFSSAMFESRPRRQDDDNPEKPPRENQLFIDCGDEGTTAPRLFVSPASLRRHSMGSLIWGWLTGLFWIRSLFCHASSHPTSSYSIFLDQFLLRTLSVCQTLFEWSLTYVLHRHKLLPLTHTAAFSIR